MINFTQAEVEALVQGQSSLIAELENEIVTCPDPEHFYRELALLKVKLAKAKSLRDKLTKVWQNG